MIGETQQPIVNELCRFCGTCDRVRDRFCDHCRTELHIIVNHESFKGTGLEIPPDEIDIMEPKTLQMWCDWAKRMDGGGGSHGPSRQDAIDSIFAAAKLGMMQASRSQKQRDKAIAKHLRRLADEVERESH